MISGEHNHILGLRYRRLTPKLMHHLSVDVVCVLWSRPDRTYALFPCDLRDLQCRVGWRANHDDHKEFASCKRLKRATPRTSRVCTKLRHTKLVQDSEDEEIFRRRHLRAMGIISSILACNVIEGWSIYLICHARKAKYLKWQVKHQKITLTLFKFVWNSNSVLPTLDVLLKFAYEISCFAEWSRWDAEASTAQGRWIYFVLFKEWIRTFLL